VYIERNRETQFQRAYSDHIHAAITEGSRAEMTGKRASRNDEDKRHFPDGDIGRLSVFTRRVLRLPNRRSSAFLSLCGIARTLI